MVLDLFMYMYIHVPLPFTPHGYSYMSALVTCTACIYQLYPTCKTMYQLYPTCKTTNTSQTHYYNYHLYRKSDQITSARWLYTETTVISHSLTHVQISTTCNSIYHVWCKAHVTGVVLVELPSNKNSLINRQFASYKGILLTTKQSLRNAWCNAHGAVVSGTHIHVKTSRTLLSP